MHKTNHHTMHCFKLCNKFQLNAHFKWGQMWQRNASCCKAIIGYSTHFDYDMAKREKFETLSIGIYGGNAN